MSEQGLSNINERFAAVVQKAWTDSAFKERLLKDARSAVKELGMEIPAGLDIRFIENTPTVRYFVIPPQPSEELSEEELAAVAGGGAGAAVVTATINASIKFCEDIPWEDVGDTLNPTNW